MQMRNIVFNTWSDVHLLQTASINKGVEKSKHEGKFSISNRAVLQIMSI